MGALTAVTVDEPDGIVGAGAVTTWRPDVCREGVKVEIDGGCVDIGMFWRLGRHRTRRCRLGCSFSTGASRLRAHNLIESLSHQSKQLD